MRRGIIITPDHGTDFHAPGANPIGSCAFLQTTFFLIPCIRSLLVPNGGAHQRRCCQKKKDKTIFRQYYSRGQIIVIING